MGMDVLVAKWNRGTITGISVIEAGLKAIAVEPKPRFFRRGQGPWIQGSVQVLFGGASRWIGER
jgi:hypothetical protein